MDDSQSHWGLIIAATVTVVSAAFILFIGRVLFTPGIGFGAFVVVPFLPALFVAVPAFVIAYIWCLVALWRRRPLTGAVSWSVSLILLVLSMLFVALPWFVVETGPAVAPLGLIGICVIVLSARRGRRT